MSGSRRKLGSKWDLVEESQLSHEKVWDSAWSGKAGISYHEKESRSRRFSPKVGSCNDGYKWSGREADDIRNSKHDLQFSSREPLLRSKGSRKDDSINDYWEKTTWDGDGSYGKRMSPGLDDWRQQIHHRSPKNDWSGRHRSRSRSRSCSRSRSWNQSRSPVRGFRRESDIYCGNRGRPGVSAQLCKDFASGKCRRGSHCHFSHRSSQTYEDSWESRHRAAGAPKYSTPHESREYPMSGRNREGSLETRGEHESYKKGDIPCKFFAAGNCRSGKYCRFFHSSQALASPNRRSQDDGLVWGHNSNDTKWNGPKWSDANNFSNAVKLSEAKNERMGATRTLQDDKLVQNHNSDNLEKLWDGPMWSGADTFPDTTLGENQDDRMGAPGPRFTAWSTDDRLPHSLDDNRAHANQRAVSHEGGDSNKIESPQCQMKKVGSSESGGTENCLGDMEMSPDWNYTVKSSKHSMNEDHGHIPQSRQSLPISDTSLLHEQAITREPSVLLHDAVTTIQPMIMDKSYLKQDAHQRNSDGAALPCSDKNAIGKTAISPIDLNFSAYILPTQTFDQIGQVSSALPFSSLNSIGQSQGAITSEPSKGGNINLQNHTVFQVEKTISKPDIGDGSAPRLTSGIQQNQNMVSGEQLNQLTDSLVQFLGNGQQLPQLYAALNTHNVMQVASSANSEGPIAPDSAVASLPNEAIRSQKQYDPLCDSLEPKKVENQGLQINIAGQKSNADGKQNGGSEKTDDKIPIQQGSDANCKVSDINSGIGAEEDKKAQVENKIPQENVKVQKTDGEDEYDKADDGKKSKDTKGIRAFKFALAEFVKELLKPAWKEGQINKDAYKSVVKKVVDKVISTMQGVANIPQTQEKIDQYLSFSKPKLCKLVQAYVEKFRKG